MKEGNMLYVVRTFVFSFKGIVCFFSLWNAARGRVQSRLGSFLVLQKNLKLSSTLRHKWYKVLRPQNTLIKDCDIESKMQHKEDFSQR